MASAESWSVDSLRQIVRSRRVYFEILPEVILLGEERQPAGYELKLWALHEKGARALPGCRKCWEIVEDLQQIAAWLVNGDRHATWEIQAFDRVLYDSRQAPATDEIDLSLRLRHAGGGPDDFHVRRSLREVHRKLAELGVPEGGWHPAAAAAHGHA